MHVNQKNWLWNGVFISIILGLCASVYLAGKQIDYSWNWERVVPFIINSDPLEIVAEVDGTLEINEQGQPQIYPYDGGDPQLIDPALALSLSEGDMVYAGDVLASIEQTRIGPLLEGLLVTIEISVISLLFAVVIGLMVGLMRVSVNPALRNLAITYIEVIRGTPLLVQIFIVYFFLGTVLDMERFTAGVVALSVFTAAYVAEIIRAGIQSIPVGQMEAARSLGMSYPKAMIYVILPQAFKRTLPPLAGQFINLIKDSSLVSVIAITDLTKAGREVISGNFAPFEVWFTVALLYLLLTSTLSWAIQRLERRLAASD